MACPDRRGGYAWRDGTGSNTLKGKDRHEYEQ